MTKSDQTGKDADTVWQVYDTPSEGKEESYSFLALAIYLFSVPSILNGKRLFDGTSQYGQFQRSLKEQ